MMVTHFFKLRDSVLKESVKKFGKLGSGHKAGEDCRLAAKKERGYSAFVTLSLHSHQVPSKNKELYFYLGHSLAPVVEILASKTGLISNPMYTARTKSHLCSTPALCQQEHIPKGDFTQDIGITGISFSHVAFRNRGGACSYISQHSMIEAYNACKFCLLVWMRDIKERQNNYSYNYVSMSMIPEYSLPGCLASSSDNTKKKERNIRIVDEVFVTVI